MVRFVLNNSLSLLHKSPHVRTHKPRTGEIVRLMRWVALFIKDAPWRSELVYLGHPEIIRQLVLQLIGRVD